MNHNLEVMYSPLSINGRLNWERLAVHSLAFAALPRTREVLSLVTVSNRPKPASHKRDRESRSAACFIACRDRQRYKTSLRFVKFLRSELWRVCYEERRDRERR